MPWYFWLIFFIGIIFIFAYISNENKRKRLMERYKDENLVQKLMMGSFWQGQTKGQLVDSIGQPKNVSEQVLKTKKKETWKYQKTGNNRYALKIFIENGIVTGWDQK